MNNEEGVFLDVCIDDEFCKGYIVESYLIYLSDIKEGKIIVIDKFKVCLVIVIDGNGFGVIKIVE